jgi:hypothetical protein
MFCMKTPFLLPGVFAFAGLGASLIASAAWAQTATNTPVTNTPAPDAPSAAIAQPQAASTQSDSLDSQIAAWTQPPPADGAANPGAGQPPPRQIHGQAGVGIGSSGYRSGYVEADIPIGRASDLDIAVGESEIKPKHYGTIKSQSLAVSLTLGGGGYGAPVNCASPTAPTDGRYLEPAWEARMHGEALARDQADCRGPVAGPTARGGGPPAE